MGKPLFRFDGRCSSHEKNKLRNGYRTDAYQKTLMQEVSKIKIKWNLSAQFKDWLF